MTNARTARAQRKATPSAERRASLRVLKAKDTRQPIKLNPQSFTGSTILKIVNAAVQQALNSEAAHLAVSGFADGRELKGDWGIRVKNLTLGDVYLVPRREEEIEDEAKEPEKETPGGVAKPGAASNRQAHGPSIKAPAADRAVGE